MKVVQKGPSGAFLHTGGCLLLNESSAAPTGAFALLSCSNKQPPVSQWIGGNRECRFLNNFSFSIAKINVFDCQNRYNGNRKRLI